MKRKRRGKLRKYTQVERKQRRVKQAEDDTRPARIWARRHVQQK